MLLRIIREPVYTLVWAGLSFLLFDVCLYLMITLTGSRDNMCMVGANLTWENTIFSILLSLGLGLIVTILAYSAREHVRIGATTSVLGTLGSLIGFFTLFCGVCSLSLISSLLVSLGLGAISFADTERFLGPLMEFSVTYNVLVKVACLVMIGVTLWFLEKRLATNWMCALPRKKR